MTDDEFLDAFERAALSRADWTHAAHIRMAWLYSRRAPSLDVAIARMQAGIPRLNAALGTPAHFYHETVTCAFGTLVYRRATSAGAQETWPAFQAAHPELFDRREPVLHRHYDPETLASERARTEYLAPDREPF